MSQHVHLTFFHPYFCRQKKTQKCTEGTSNNSDYTTQAFMAPKDAVWRSSGHSAPSEELERAARLFRESLKGTNFAGSTGIFYGGNSRLYTQTRSVRSKIGKERPGRDATPSPLLVPWSRKSRAEPLLSLWIVRPVQSLSACTRVHFTCMQLQDLSLVMSNHGSFVAQKTRILQYIQRSATVLTVTTKETPCTMK